MPSRAVLGRAASSRPASANSPSSASSSAACAAAKRRALPFTAGVVMDQARLVQAIDQRNPLDPSPAPMRQPHFAGRAVDKITALMRPAPAKDHGAVEFARHLLVGAVVVADDGRMVDGRAEQRLRDLRAARGVDVEVDRVIADRGPQPGAARAALLAKRCTLSPSVPAEIGSPWSESHAATRRRGRKQA